MAYSPLSDAEIKAGVASVSSSVISKLANNIEEIAIGGSGAPRLRIAAMPAPTAGNAVIREWRSDNGNQVVSLTSTYNAFVVWPVVVSGSFRFRVTLTNTAASGTFYGRIYRNGAAYGTERSVAAGATGTWTQDLSLSEGDQVRLYLRHTADTYSFAEFKCGVSAPLRPIAKTL